jgi:hypothetical protein
MGDPPVSSLVGFLCGCLLRCPRLYAFWGAWASRIFQREVPGRARALGASDDPPRAGFLKNGFVSEAAGADRGAYDVNWGTEALESLIGWTLEILRSRRGYGGRRSQLKGLIKLIGPGSAEPGMVKGCWRGGGGWKADDEKADDEMA